MHPIDDRWSANSSRSGGVSVCVQWSSLLLSDGVEVVALQLSVAYKLNSDHCIAGPERWHGAKFLNIYYTRV